MIPNDHFDDGQLQKAPLSLRRQAKIAAETIVLRRKCEVLDSEWSGLTRCCPTIFQPNRYQRPTGAAPEIGSRVDPINFKSLI